MTETTSELVPLALRIEKSAGIRTGGSRWLAIGNGSLLDSTAERVIACGGSAVRTGQSLPDLYVGYGSRIEDMYLRGYCAGGHAELVGPGMGDGLYALFGAAGRRLVGVGDGALANAIGDDMIATGKDAGRGAEGSRLRFEGDYSGTATVWGAEMPVSAIARADAAGSVIWTCPDHGFGTAGQRVNLGIVGDDQPRYSPSASADSDPRRWVPYHAGQLWPFRVIDGDRLEINHDKYPALDPGSNVRLRANTNRPTDSWAIGAGSRITKSWQIVIDGVDLSPPAWIARRQAVEG